MSVIRVCSLISLETGGLDDDSLSQLAASHGWQTVTREDGIKMMEID
jgi:hypothetical protein